MVRKKVPSSFFSLSKDGEVKERKSERKGQYETVHRGEKGKQILIPSQESDGMDGDSEEDTEPITVLEKGKGSEEYAMINLSEEAGTSTTVEKVPAMDDMTSMEKLALAKEEGRIVGCLITTVEKVPAKVDDSTRIEKLALSKEERSTVVCLCKDKGKGTEDCAIQDDEEVINLAEEAGTSITVEKVPAMDDITSMEKLALAKEEGRIVGCLYKDGAYHPAKVLEIKERPVGFFKYYVHYINMNRRNDKWVELRDLDADHVEELVDIMTESQPESGVLTRRQKQKIGRKEEHEGLDPETLREHEELTKVKTISSIQIGNSETETWYYSPLPPEYHDCEKLYVCEYCLTFMKTKQQLNRHKLENCHLYYPSGKQIYTSESWAVFEVDGTKQRVYTENLCYLAKMFIDHKSLVFEVADFIFYILCEMDFQGFQFAAYFSKEKDSENNLACIVTLPQFQLRGYGSFLIALSYELSIRERKIGRPEHPLSDLGRTGYKKYWTQALLEILNQNKQLSIEGLKGGDLSCNLWNNVVTNHQHAVDQRAQSLDLLAARTKKISTAA